MNWFVGSFRCYEFLSTGKDGAREMYGINPVDAGIARFL
jgi:hypothetical protein